MPNSLTRYFIQLFSSTRKLEISGIKKFQLFKTTLYTHFSSFPLLLHTSSSYPLLPLSSLPTSISSLFHFTTPTLFLHTLTSPTTLLLLSPLAIPNFPLSYFPSLTIFPRTLHFLYKTSLTSLSLLPIPRPTLAPFLSLNFPPHFLYLPIPTLF